jgi:hypothetical protein
VRWERWGQEEDCIADDAVVVVVVVVVGMVVDEVFGDGEAERGRLRDARIRLCWICRKYQ